ncbi:carbohydrate porin [Undibacterium sp. FT79W]|nr:MULTISPECIES: carbohydrate porin [unclassified Undibacterium]MBC3878315.1 carbohydrate porin [Undibacterium sp. FT79W]MBC3927327.1 carbohydrate porin [Undibacterium sp. CY21W]
MEHIDTSCPRPNDKVGIAGTVNSLSPNAKAYFSTGGIGILIGDGQLNYGREKIIETYYSATLAKNLKLSFDFQHVTNPTYNRDRGPFSIYAVRLHAEL